MTTPQQDAAVVAGRFSKVEGGVSDLKFNAAGTVTYGADGWRFTCRQAPAFLRVGLGIIGVIVAVAVTVAVTMFLDEVLDFDLMDYRKGPVLVGMSALALSIGLWTLASRLCNALFGSERSETVAPGVPVQVTRHATNAKALNVLWPTESNTWRGTAFEPKDPNAAAYLLNIPRQ